LNLVMKFVDPHWYLRHSSANAIISATTMFILWEGVRSHMLERIKIF